MDMIKTLSMAWLYRSLKTQVYTHSEWVVTTWQSYEGGYVQCFFKVWLEEPSSNVERPPIFKFVNILLSTTVSTKIWKISEAAGQF